MRARTEAFLARALTLVILASLAYTLWQVAR